MPAYSFKTVSLTEILLVHNFLNFVVFAFIKEDWDVKLEMISLVC